MRSRPAAVLAGLLVLVAGSTLLAICLGSVSIPLSVSLRYLVTGDAGNYTVLLTQVRLPRAATAALAGAGLAVAGLLMQTLFANPLADPYILGVSSGAGLGVAVSVLGVGSGAATFVVTLGATGRLRTVVAGAVGALAVLGLVLLIGRWVRSVVALLIIGVMIGAAAGAVVSLLLSVSAPERIQQYVMWGMGSVDGTSWPDLVFLAPAVAIGVVLAGYLARPLNALLLGESYAASMGVHVRRLRALAIVAAAILSGAITAFCGPIAFLGIAVPHLTRIALGRADHRWLVPGTVLMGAMICQVCAVLSQLPGSTGVLPLNVVTAAIGAPVVIGVLVRSRTLAAGAAA